MTVSGNRRSADAEQTKVTPREGSMADVRSRERIRVRSTRA
jgi:hypothetical protein